MGQLVQFPLEHRRVGPGIERRPAGQILIFTGVRVERTDRTLAPSEAPAGEATRAKRAARAPAVQEAPSSGG